MKVEETITMLMQFKTLKMAANQTSRTLDPYIIFIKQSLQLHHVTSNFHVSCCQASQKIWLQNIMQTHGTIYVPNMFHGQTVQRNKQYNIK